MSKRYRYALGVLILAILTVNLVAFVHAYHFTHFSDTSIPRSEARADIPFTEKLSMLLLGVENPRPKNTQLPDRPYQTVSLVGNERLEGWWIEVPQAKGTVILFHGYAGNKSDMLPVAEAFLSSGYRALLVDFLGSGGSDGNVTTIGYREALDVKAAFDHARSQYPDEPVVLYGVSMGSVAIMRAIEQYTLIPTAIVLECPFGTMLETVRNRFALLNVPAFPMAELLVLWGGVQHGYWAFSHNPVAYARSVKVPTLLLYGLQDPKVTLSETERIYEALPGKKQLVTFDKAGHELYATQSPERWQEVTQDFLASYVLSNNQ